MLLDLEKHDLQAIAYDGIQLGAVQPLKQLLIAPGQRADILVKAGGPRHLRSSTRRPTTRATLRRWGRWRVRGLGRADGHEAAARPAAGAARVHQGHRDRQPPQGGPRRRPHRGRRRRSLAGIGSSSSTARSSIRPASTSGSSSGRSRSGPSSTRMSMTSIGVSRIRPPTRSRWSRSTARRWRCRNGGDS